MSKQAYRRPNPRTEVKLMAFEMERRLRKHDEDRGRAGWKQCDVAYLIARLREETEELVAALIDQVDPGTVWSEAADVGNMAMMVADVYEEQHCQ